MFSLQNLSANHSFQAHNRKMISSELYFNWFPDVDELEVYCSITTYKEKLK